MSRFGVFLLNIAVAFYLFVNGIVGFINANVSDFSPIVSTIFKGWRYNYMLIIVLSVCAIIAGILLITAIFKDDLLITNVILFIFIVLWSIFIVVVDIINPLSFGRVVFLDYLQKLSTHLMILGALILSIKRLRRI
jgi:hypothetical protein